MPPCSPHGTQFVARVYGSYSCSYANFEMTEKDFDLRVAEEYGKAQAILETLQQLVEKVKEDPSKKGPKLKSSIVDIKLHFVGSLDGLAALRSDIDTSLEKCVLASRDVGNIDQAINKLSSIRAKLEVDDVTKTECTKWAEDLLSIKNTLEKRYQIKKVDSEKQASVSSLTEQLKQKDLQIEQLNKSVQERDLQLQEVQKQLGSQTPK